MQPPRNHQGTTKHLPRNHQATTPQPPRLSGTPPEEGNGLRNVQEEGNGEHFKRTEVNFPPLYRINSPPLEGWQKFYIFDGVVDPE